MSERRRRSSRGRQATLGGTVLAVAIALLLQSLDGPEESSTDAARVDASAPHSTAAADERIEAAVREEKSGFMITVDGEVLKMLEDDNDGSRHQRFVIELASGRTLLVAHNIDLAPRVPTSRGERLRIHGQYEWNPRGGVLHWTHHDPEGRHEGGFIERSGKRYR